jgi:hypothetical protein
VFTEYNQLLHQSFHGSPVFVSIGNHEMFPINQFNGPGVDSWLYTNVSALWTEWINNPYVVHDTVPPSSLLAFAGYYTTLIKPGLRLIVINTGFMQTDNWYLQWTSTARDIANQLSWLENVLQQALQLRESVYIMQHLPLSHFDNSYLQNAYYAVYQKYASIIKATFCGHTHLDTYHVLSTYSSNNNNNNNDNNDNIMEAVAYSEEQELEEYLDEYLEGDIDDEIDIQSTKIPFAVEFNAGAVTTFGGKYPEFRVFQYNRASFEILDYYQYIFNISEANAHPAWTNHTWITLYEMKRDFGMGEDFSAQAFVNVALSFADQQTLFEKYEYHYRGGYLPEGELPVLDKNSTICLATTATQDEYLYCTQHQFASQVQFDETLI